MSQVQFEFIRYKSYKFIIFVACIVYTLWSPFYRMADSTNYDPLWGRLALALPLSLITVISYFFESLDRRMKFVFYAFAIFIVTHFHYLLYMNELKPSYRLGSIVLLFSLCVIIESEKFKTFMMSYYLCLSFGVSYYFEGLNFYDPQSKSALLLLGSLTVISMTFLTQYFFSRVHEALRKEISENNNLRKWSSLGQMAGGVAHEINSPLTTIFLSTDNLQDMITEGAGSEDIKKEVDKIKKDAMRISSIMKSLRLLTKEGTKFSRDPVHLHKVCLDVIDQYREATAQINLRVLFHTSLSERPLVLGDTQSITQVLSNLFKNAIDAMKNYDEKWIKLTLMEDSKNFIILVQDSGRGIPREVQDRIFEPFYSTKEVGKGMGIGLSLSRQIAIAHGGDLVVDDSQPNTTFKLLIPKPNSFEMDQAA